MPGSWYVPVPFGRRRNLTECDASPDSSSPVPGVRFPLPKAEGVVAIMGGLNTLNSLMSVEDP